MPPDANDVEQEIALYSLLNIYDRFDDPIDKLIICQVFELRYPQTFVAQVLGRTKKNISLRVKRIRIELSKAYKLDQNSTSRPYNGNHETN